VAAVAAYLEKKGIPTVVQVDDVPSIKKIAMDYYLAGGVPAVRTVYIPPAKWTEKCPEEDLSKFLDALTKPLTDAEKRSGKYKPPASPRIAMTGTYDEVQDFFTGDLSIFVDSAPIARWTDGLPITPPTPEAVARMLKGTSHKPDEIVHPAMGPMLRPVTVEKVAINAVMAGCKQEQLPVCLAITAGGLKNTWGSGHSMGFVEIVSGPIVKEIGMNSGIALMTAGNPANMSIERFVKLAIKNLTGVTPGLNNINAYGANLMGLVLPESPDTPWEGLNVRYGFSPKESVIIQLGSKVAILGFDTNETTLQGEKPTVQQQLISALKAFYPTGAQARIVIVAPEEARSWKEKYGWDTMAKLQDYLWDNVTWPRKNFDLSYWWGTARNPFKNYVAALKSERGSRMQNPDHVGMPPDAMVPMLPSPKHYVILVAGGGAPHYNDLQAAFTWGVSGEPLVLPIDKWK
jgi:hypothetical protein